MTQVQVWSWPSGRLVCPSLANQIKSCKQPELHPKRPAAVLSMPFSCSSGQGSGAEIWIGNTSTFVRIGMSRRVHAYQPVLCPYHPDKPPTHPQHQLSGHLSQVTGTEGDLHPRDQCRTMIGYWMKNLRCQRVVRSCRIWKAFVNKALIYGRASRRSQIAALQLVVTNYCCWVVLSLYATHSWLLLCLQISFHCTMSYFFVAAFSFSVESLGRIDRWYRNESTVYVHIWKEDSFSLWFLLLHSNTNIQ